MESHFVGYDEENPLKGVFNYLNQNYPDSVEVLVSSSSSYAVPESLISEESEGKYWESDDKKPNPWVQFNLKDIKLNAIGYVLKSTYHASDNGYPNSWMLAGSNDGENWCNLDQIDDRNNLAVPDSTNAFECSDKESEEAFSMFRLVMTEPTIDGKWCFRIARVELFGDLYFNKE